MARQSKLEWIVNRKLAWALLVTTVLMHGGEARKGTRAVRLKAERSGEGIEITWEPKSEPLDRGFFEGSVDLQKWTVVPEPLQSGDDRLFFRWEDLERHQFFRVKQSEE